MSLAFDRVADEYDETRGGEERGLRYATFLEPHFSSQGRTLEVGIGTGIVARPLRERGREIVGVDLSVPMLRRALGRVGARVAQADAQRLPVADASVDDAYSVWVLHVVSDVSQVLAEVARVLRPGGRYLIVPSSPGPPDGMDDAVRELVSDMHEVLRGRSRSDDPDRVERLADLAPAAGLRLVDVVEGQSEFAETPSAIAANIERRTYSVLWDLEPARWEQVVRPVIAALRALPDPDLPRARFAREQVIVLERPA